MLYPLRERKMFFQKPYFLAFPVIYHLREKKFFVKAALFAISRWLLFGGRNFLKAPRQMAFPTGNKWREK